MKGIVAASVSAASEVEAGGDFEQGEEDLLRKLEAGDGDLDCSGGGGTTQTSGDEATVFGVEDTGIYGD